MCNKLSVQGNFFSFLCNKMDASKRYKYQKLYKAARRKLENKVDQSDGSDSEDFDNGPVKKQRIVNLNCNSDSNTQINQIDLEIQQAQKPQIEN